MKREERAERAKQLLMVAPMSRYALECKLGISQQRTSEAIRDIGARVVGYEPRDTRGHPMPIYGFRQPEAAKRIGPVSSVWQLGSLT